MTAGARQSEKKTKEKGKGEGLLGFLLGQRGAAGWAKPSRSVWSVQNPFFILIFFFF
jgi:hypothetical protein